VTDVRLPDFPRHWLAVQGEDATKPEPHDHALCDWMEGAIACQMTSGWRFTGRTTTSTPEINPK
jgi:hypothetical protein